MEPRFGKECFVFLNLQMMKTATCEKYGTKYDAAENVVYSSSSVAFSSLTDFSNMFMLKVIWLIFNLDRASLVAFYISIFRLLIYRYHAYKPNLMFTFIFIE